MTKKKKQILAIMLMEFPIQKIFQIILGIIKIIIILPMEIILLITQNIKKKIILIIFLISIKIHFQMIA